MIWPRTDGLRSGPETSHLGCVWHTEAAGFAAGSRQFASKLAPTASGPNQKRTCVYLAYSGASARRACELARDGLRSGPETGHLGCV
ncbi:hypothetical protein CXB34_18130 [Pseudomonas amygdali pv. morsprunorum]|nr:hypothetical protein CXB34_18130 [Pseudomonas amygdali pv. morsprunorum]